ncbi:MAG: LysR family transcriptional regulator [Firmicutes bacterium]|nr:LysR family transcriptional regulator [Bacillota bacterium]
MDTKLRTFLTVARKGSFSAAARELHLSQPAVSMQIQQLESQYGVRLFDRLDRRIRLTPAGLLLQKYAREILAVYQKASAEIMHCCDKIMGELHIGATLTIGEYVIPKLIGLFKKEYPEVELLLTVENTESVIRGLADELFDVAFVEGPFDHAKLERKPWSTDELVLVVSADHPWATRKSVHVEELLQENLVLREPGSGTREVFMAALRKAGYSWDQVPVYIELGSTTAIKSLVSANLGMTVISRWTVRDEVQRGSLRALPVDGLELTREFTVVTRKKHPLNPQSEKFIEFCFTHLE